MNSERERQFEEMMLNEPDTLGSIPDGHEGHQEEIERGGPMLKTDPGAKPKVFKEPLKQTRREIRILECALQTDEYMGYLRGSKILSALRSDSKMVGFYQAKIDDFIMQNQP